MCAPWLWCYATKASEMATSGATTDCWLSPQKNMLESKFSWIPRWMEVGWNRLSEAISTPHTARSTLHTLMCALVKHHTQPFRWPVLMLLNPDWLAQHTEQHCPLFCTRMTWTLLKKKKILCQQILALSQINIVKAALCFLYFSYPDTDFNCKAPPIAIGHTPDLLFNMGVRDESHQATDKWSRLSF